MVSKYISLTLLMITAGIHGSSSSNDKNIAFQNDDNKIAFKNIKKIMKRIGIDDYASTKKVEEHLNISLSNSQKHGVHCNPLSYPLLHLSVFDENPKLMKELIKNGSSINGIDHAGNTALHIASALNLIKPAKFLLNNGAFASPRNLNDLTPLHVATTFNSVAIVKLLLPFIDVNERTNHKFNALEIAVQKDFDEISHFLCNNGAQMLSPDTPKKLDFLLRVAAKENNKQKVQDLLQIGADPRHPNKNDQLPINLTTNKEIKKILIAAMNNK